MVKKAPNKEDEKKLRETISNLKSRCRSLQKEVKQLKRQLAIYEVVVDVDEVISERRKKIEERRREECVDCGSKNTRSYIVGIWSITTCSDCGITTREATRD
jgi:hypothetical protein